jgi:methyltransferase FkbM-like protein
MRDRTRRALGRSLKKGLADGQGRARRLPFGLGHGLELEVDPTSPLDMYVGLYEFEIADYVREFCRPGYRSLDIGGFDGYYALVFSRLTGSDVIVFDSDLEACRRIQRNCTVNPTLGARIDVRHAYVAFETNPSENCVALDDCLHRGEVFEPDLMKIDVDRAELSALSGAKKLLSARRPHLIVETHSLELEQRCADLLLELGYRPRVVSQRRWLAQNRSLPHNRWLIARGGDR